MPPQINRLIILTVLIVGAYLAARSILTPSSFGQYGWYRGDALREIAALPKAYAGKAACSECHEAVLETLQKAQHKTLSCESCHGANQAHADDYLKPPQKISNPQFCLQCHRYDAARPETFPQVDPAEHFGDNKCAECHEPHKPKDAPTNEKTQNK